MAQMTSPADLAAWRPELDTPVWERFPEVTAANAQEVYPGVGDPISFDVNLYAIDQGERRFAERLGLAKIMGLDGWPHVAFFASYYGHVFINISAFRELVKWIPQGDPDAMDEQLFGLSRPAGAAPFKPSLKQQLVRMRTLLKLIPLLRGLPKALAANNSTVENYLQKMQSADLTQLTDEQLMTELDSAFRRNVVTAEIHIANTILSGSAFENLRVFLVAQGVEDSNAVIADLCTGLEDVESARPGRELARLSGLIRGDEALKALFSLGSETAVLAALRGSSDPSDSSVQAFRAQFEQFLRSYGYRGVRELGMETRVWSMRPDSVIGLLQSYTHRDNALDPAAALREQERRREHATATLDARLKGGARRKFRGLLKAAHAGISGRELSKSQWVRSTHPVRLIVIETGRRLQERGAIPVAADVFFLRMTELKELIAGGTVAGIAATIARRHVERERCLEIETDERFSGRPVPRLRQAPATASGPASSAVLSGLAVSPGRVTAKARVITELEDEVELEQGEVLVCPFTDAAWTPLFFNAAAVVMDLGGPLSHGSTVAREYGIPAVVNVKTGTTMIRDGQMITVDGTKGEVTLIGG